MTTRVIHVASGREWRGGQRQVWLLARELERGGGLTQVVVTGAGTELARRLRADGVPTREVAWRAGLDPRVIPALASELRLGPALLHAHDGHSVTLAGLAAWYARRPLVVTRRVVFPLRRLGLWSRADRVIAVSEAVASVLRTDGIAAERIVVVHSGIDIAEVERAAPLDIRGRLSLAGDAFLAVSIGALGRDKDHATMLHAAALLKGRYPALHWIIAGEGPERPALEQLLVTLELRDRVHLVGEVPDAVRLIAAGDILVMSSRQEGLGTAVLEAMARGIPVASTSAGGVPELLAEGAGLLVPPERPEALADAVARLVADPVLRGALQGRARIAVQRFSAQRMAGEVRSVYRSCGPLN